MEQVSKSSYDPLVFRFFAENLGDVSDEHGERFHQDTLVMEQRFKRKSNPGMLADLYWVIKREDPTPRKRFKIYGSWGRKRKWCLIWRNKGQFQNQDNSFDPETGLT